MPPATVVFLVRHGHTDAVGTRLTSRMAGVHLSEAGARQVEHVRDRLAAAPIAAIYSSPLERTRATAAAIASAHRIEVQVLDALNEVHFGEWTGMTFDELAPREDWQAFNRDRGTAVVPGGECAPDVQRRIVAALEDLHRRHPGELVVAVSHGDVIRNAVLYAAGTSLDLWQRFEIAPASISAVVIGDAGMRLLLVNETPGRLPRS